MSISVSVDTTKINELLATIPGNKNVAVRETANWILEDSKKSGAYQNRSGELRSNNEVSLEYAGWAIVEYNAEYAAYVEMGTWKMAARPFLKPSVEKAEPILAEKIAKGLFK
jgi:HK97 gp10 family phage protein